MYSSVLIKILMYSSVLIKYFKRWPSYPISAAKIRDNFAVKDFLKSLIKSWLW